MPCRCLVLLLVVLTAATSVYAQPRDAGRIEPDTASITTVPAPPPPARYPPAPKLTPLPKVRAALMVQSVPIMELIGMHTEVRLDDPFGDAWLRGIGLTVGAGYSAYTPSFAPILLTSLWGRRHYLELALGTSIPINPVYGTNAGNPLTWPTDGPTVTTLVGYRFQADEHGLMYRVFVKALMVEGLNGGLLPCLGGSIGFTL